MTHLTILQNPKPTALEVAEGKGRNSLLFSLEQKEVFLARKTMKELEDLATRETKKDQDNGQPMIRHCHLSLYQFCCCLKHTRLPQLSRFSKSRLHNLFPKARNVKC